MMIDARPIDAAPIDSPPCVPGFIDLCKATPRTDALVITADAEIDTGTDPRCVVTTQAGGPDLCLLYFTNVDIQVGATLLVYGTRALALASTAGVTISGTLDASSRRDRLAKTGPGSGLCVFATDPQNDDGGGGGGAGGTLATQGGGGGIGDQNQNRGNDGTGLGGTPGVAVAALTTLRGGCSGQPGGKGTAMGPGGDGGPAGGAVYLAAKTSIQLSGKVLATGAGGGGGAVRAGGGGAGSGGAIVLQAPTIAMSGLLLATGGGGGEGGDADAAGDVGKEPITAAAALGGATLVGGGDGGTGSTNAAGGPGDISDGGGGGGGGGGGFIRVLSPAAMISGETAPTAVVVP